MFFFTLICLSLATELQILILSVCSSGSAENSVVSCQGVPGSRSARVCTHTDTSCVIRKTPSRDSDLFPSVNITILPSLPPRPSPHTDSYPYALSSSTLNTQLLFERGDRCSEMYLVVDGCVALSLTARCALTLDCLVCLSA
jgi:hypothetical protein